MARRPADESTSVSVESCSFADFEKNLLAAVFTIASSSPTQTMAEARTVTLTGAGRPLVSLSAVWSVISMSTLIACAGMRRTCVITGTIIALHGPRKMRRLRPRLANRISPASTLRKKVVMMTDVSISTATTAAPAMNSEGSMIRSPPALARPLVACSTARRARR